MQTWPVSLSIQKFKAKAMLNAFEKWCVIFVILCHYLEYFKTFDSVCQEVALLDLLFLTPTLLIT